MTAKAACGWSSSSPLRSSSDRDRRHEMAEVLVLVDHVDGDVRKTTTELLTIARRLGEPSAVFIGAGYEAAKEVLAGYGAAKVYVADAPELSEFLVAPQAEVLAHVAASSSPAAVLLASTPDGKEIAGRLAVKLESGLITDAVDVASDGTTTQSVFAGNWTVTAAVTHGVPVITVKPNAVSPEVAPAEPAIEQVEVTISDAAKSARIVNSEPKQSSGRPELT